MYNSWTKNLGNSITFKVDEKSRKKLKSVSAHVYPHKVHPPRDYGMSTYNDVNATRAVIGHCSWSI